jgi:hypothetical protein
MHILRKKTFVHMDAQNQTLIIKGSQVAIIATADASSEPSREAHIGMLLAFNAK